MISPGVAWPCRPHSKLSPSATPTSCPPRSRRDADRCRLSHGRPPGTRPVPAGGAGRPRRSGAGRRPHGAPGLRRGRTQPRDQQHVRGRTRWNADRLGPEAERRVGRGVRGPRGAVSTPAQCRPRERQGALDRAGGDPGAGPLHHRGLGEDAGCRRQRSPQRRAPLSGRAPARQLVAVHRGRPRDQGLDTASPAVDPGEGQGRLQVLARRVRRSGRHRLVRQRQPDRGAQAAARRLPALSQLPRHALRRSLADGARGGGRWRQGTRACGAGRRGERTVPHEPRIPGCPRAHRRAGCRRPAAGTVSAAVRAARRRRRGHRARRGLPDRQDAGTRP